MTTGGAAGVFLDRDGTLIEDPGYLGRAELVRLLPGAAEAVRRLNHLGLVTVVVTNQSGIARGRYSYQDYLGTERRLDELLAAQGARIDAHYACPHHPDFTGPCDCRKPGVRLFRQAASRFALDLRRCWWLGDRLRDVLPARALGGRGILVHPSRPDEAASAGQEGLAVVPDLEAALRLIAGKGPA